MTFTLTVSTWDDTGYTEEGCKRPPLNAALLNPDHVYTGLHPGKQRVFDSVEIADDYDTLRNTSYIKVQYTTNNGDGFTLFGWVDRVRMISDTYQFPVTAIDWHVDNWRTYKQTAVFGLGMVLRRPVSGDQPPQPYSHINYVKPASGGFTALIDNDGLYWVLINYVREYGSSTNTLLEFAAVPVSSAHPSNEFYITDGTETVAAPSLGSIAHGLLEEMMGIDPQSIVSVCISPVAPGTVSGSGTQASPYSITTGSWTVLKNSAATLGVLRDFNHDEDSYYEFTNTVGPFKADDTHRYLITGMDGKPMGELPYGITCGQYKYRLVNAIASQYIEIRFDGLESSSEGLCFTTVCPQLPVTSNSWSSYVYSGQRDYDMNQRNLSVMKSFLGASVNTGMMGSMIDGLKGYPARGAVLGLMSSAADSALQAAVFNPLEQSYADDYAAQQTDNLVMSGDGTDCLYNGREIGIQELDMDAYSANQRSADIALFGAHVKEASASCQSLIAAGGGLRIRGLIVTGDIPAEAKREISAMFDKGVLLS